MTVPIPPGSNDLTWTYEKDDSVTAGMYMAWFDQFSFMPDSPSITLVTHSNGLVSVTIPSVVGRSYWLEYTDLLDATNWIPLSPVPGNGLPLVLTNSVTGVGQRFYRVVLQ